MLIYPTLKLSPLQGMAGMGGGVVSRALGAVPLPEIGDFYQGGYVAGYIDQSPGDYIITHGLIVAPKASGQSYKKYKNSNNDPSGTSLYDGASNTSAMDSSEYPAAHFCAGLTINGYSDWYMPARWELEIAYFNLKPSTAQNSTNSQDSNINPYAVPQRSAYTTSNPPQTSVSSFSGSSSEAFAEGFYWSSSRYSTTSAWRIGFNDGQAATSGKNNPEYVRAFRKFAV